MNFVMNLYLYVLLRKTLKHTATCFRVWAGSALGAAASAALLVAPGLPVFIKRFAGPAAVSVVVTAGIFKLKRTSEIVKATEYLYIYAFVFGGMMKFLFSYLPFLNKAQGSIWCILGAGMLGYEAAGRWLAKLKEKRKCTICKVQICGYGKGVWLSALVDTGNSLRDPVSGKPVSIVDEDVFDGLSDMKRPEKMKVIPYRSIGQEHGMMEGYEVPEILIDSGGELLRQKKVILGISKTKVSTDGRYRMILHPDFCREIPSGREGRQRPGERLRNWNRRENHDF